MSRCAFRTATFARFFVVVSRREPPPRRFGDFLLDREMGRWVGVEDRSTLSRGLAATHRLGVTVSGHLQLASLLLGVKCGHFLLLRFPGFVRGLVWSGVFVWSVQPMMTDPLDDRVSCSSILLLDKSFHKPSVLRGLGSCCMGLPYVRQPDTPIGALRLIGPLLRLIGPLKCFFLVLFFFQTTRASTFTGY